MDFLKDPPKYTRLGGTAPKGVLLVGPPGTGKTLLARAVAGEAGVPFFSMSGSEFVEMIVGVGAARVRDLFKQAREHAPAIIFIDELDAIGRARGQFAIGGSSEQEQTLNQILSEMDGFSSREGIIVLAATNQPDVLDRALLRPGRFDRRVVVNLPDKTGREAILKVHTRRVPLASDVSLAELAAVTPGLSGADLKNLVNEAALLAARREQDEVRQQDFLDALEKIVLGPERPLLLSRADKERIAYHEGGHTILGLRGARRRSGEPRDDRAARAGPRRDLSASGQRPLQLSGGLSARENRRDAGRPRGRGDRLRHQDHGRRERHRAGHRPGPPHGHAVGHERAGRPGAARAPGEPLPGPARAGTAATRPFSEATAEAIDAEVLRIIADSHEEARRLLSAHRKELDALADALLVARDPQRAGDPRGHGTPAGARSGTGMLPVPGATARPDRS